MCNRVAIQDLHVNDKASKPTMKISIPQTHIPETSHLVMTKEF